MSKRRLTLLATLVIASLSEPMATAQDVAGSTAPRPTTSIFIALIVPLAILVLTLLLMMRANKKVRPLMDRSILIAEESLRLTREQIVLQKETNRLLGQLVAERRSVG